MHSLPIFLRLRGSTVILLGDGEAAEAKRRLLERAGAKITADENADAHFAVIALDESAVEAAAARLRGRGLLVNVVDRPDLCDFTTPAIVDRDPVLIAIGTGGASAGLAKALRQRLDALLPARLGDVARALRDAREALRSRWPDPASRRRAIDRALDAGGPLDPMAEPRAGALDGWITNDAPSDGEPRLETIRLASDDPDELTLRAARLLGRADAVWHQHGVPAEILTRARADAVRRVAQTPPRAIERGLHLWIEAAA